MSPYTVSENVSAGGMTGSTSIHHLTPGEIELMARKMRAMVVAEALANVILAIAHAIGWVASPLAAWWSRTQVYDELMSMDDRMLADIGISRAEIPEVAAGRYHAAAAGRTWHGIDRLSRMRRPALPLAHNDHAAPPQVA